MTLHGDAGSAPAFYGTPLGRLAASAIARRLQAVWPDLTGQSMLGVGYPAPFLPCWDAQAYRCLNATTAHHHPPPLGSCAADPLHLPFPDLVFDRILIVHGVEPVGQDGRLLREVWRVLKDDGRIIVVAPNRTGLWAHVDSTPFGQGQPYSRPQLQRLLASAMFRPEAQESGLFVPPSASAALQRMVAGWEAVGHAMLPDLAGVIIVEAVKDTYAALPVTAPARRVVVAPEAA